MLRPPRCAALHARVDCGCSGLLAYPKVPHVEIKDSAGELGLAQDADLGRHPIPLSLIGTLRLTMRISMRSPASCAASSLIARCLTLSPLRRRQKSNLTNWGLVAPGASSWSLALGSVGRSAVPTARRLFALDGGTDGGAVPRNRLSKPNAPSVNVPAKPFTPVRFR